MNGRGAGIGRGRRARLAELHKGSAGVRTPSSGRTQAWRPRVRYCQRPAGCLARVAPPGSGPPDPETRGCGPSCSPRTIPAVGVDALKGGGGGHGAEERGRLAREQSAERIGSEGLKAISKPQSGTAAEASATTAACWLAAAFIRLSNPALTLQALVDSNSFLCFYWLSGVPSIMLRHNWL